MDTLIAYYTFSMSAVCLLNDDSLFLKETSFPVIAMVSTLSTRLSGCRNAPENWSITAWVSWREGEKRGRRCREVGEG